MQNQKIENLILKNLLINEEYSRKVYPHLKEEYFQEQHDKILFVTISEYFEKYNRFPEYSSLEIEISNKRLPLALIDSVGETLKELKSDWLVIDNSDWMVDSTETFCKDNALLNALSQAIEISQDDSDATGISKTGIPELLQKALAIEFDSRIGHNYIDDADERWGDYNNPVKKTPFTLEYFNKITEGGIEPGTLNVVSAGTGGGKSMFLINLAADYYKQGHNVLYITLEMNEKTGISKRIDANIMDIEMKDVPKIPKDKWDNKISELKKRYTGNIIVKEYPTGSAHVGHFRYLLKELKQKQNFVPSIIMIDYIGICASAKFKDKSNSYGYIKSVFEEVRGFLQESNAIGWSAVQLNRSGNSNSDPDINMIADSMGGPMTSDMLFAIIMSDDLSQMNQAVIKQFKNRYSDLYQDTVFSIGVNRSKMKFYDLNQALSNNSRPAQRVHSAIQTPKTNKTSSSSSNTNNFSGIKT